MSGHRPRKRFGQNFLHDRTVIAQIIEAIDPLPGDHVVEIGPGKGALTFALQPRCAALDLIELDRDLIAGLERVLAPSTNVRIYNDDALRFDFTRLFRSTKLRVVGNLPYNISTPLLFHLLEQAHLFEDIHVMLQREVVARMTAQPGTADYGRLSIMLQLACHTERLLDVGPGAFYPAPKVHSAVVRLTPHVAPPVSLEHPARFRRIVAQAFSQRRKTLRRSLQAVVTAEAFAHCEIDSARRPQTLTLAEFAALSHTQPPV